MTKRTRFAAGLALALAAVAGSASAIQVTTPRDGATVREKVKITVPRTGLTPRGFVGLYIDGDFVAAQAQSDKQTQPITFVWDSKQPRSKVGLTPEQQIFADGEHVIEVRSYDPDGKMIDRDQISVLLNNRVPTRNGQPVRLAYKFRPDERTAYEQRTEIETTNTTPPAAGSSTYSPGYAGGAGMAPGGYPGGAMPGMPGNSGGGRLGGRGSAMGPEGMPGMPGMPGMSSGGSGGYAPGMPGMPGGGTGNPNEPQKYLEYRKVSVHVADVNGGEALMREFPENPVTLVMNGAKQPVPIVSISRYYRLDSQGDAKLTAAMERGELQPMYNVIRLPAYSVRVGQKWKSRLNISLGAYVPQRIEVVATNTVEAIEWELGKPAARVHSTYEWKGKLSIPVLGIDEATAKLKGNSIIHFSPGTGKPLRAVHDIDGDLTLDRAKQQAKASAASALGAGGMPGMMGGGMPGAMPGGAGMAGAMPPGMPGGAGMAPGMAGGAGYGGGSIFTPQLITYKAKIHETMTAQR